MQFKYNDIPMMKGTYHISQNGTMLSFDLKGENSTFEHTFKVKTIMLHTFCQTCQA